MTNLLNSNTISAAFNRSVSKNPNKPALFFNDRSWTYQQLNEAANRLGNYLLNQGLAQGDRVLAFGKNSDAYVILWLACVKTGLVHVPTNFALNAEELAYVIHQSEAKGLVCDGDLQPKVEAALADKSLVFVANFLPAEQVSSSNGNPSILAVAENHELSANEPETSLADDSLAQFLYTSGTTAAPKAAMMTHKALMAEYFACIIELDFKADEPMLAALPLYHSAQMHVFLMPALLRGISIHLVATPLVAECLQLIEERQLVSFFAPPTLWIALLRHEDFNKRNLTSLKKVYYGASIMPVPVVKELQERLPGVGLYNCYGQSEIAPLATVLRPEDHASRPASAGKPLITVETKIVDPEMNEMPAGEQGEIIHRSPQLLTGYWNNPEGTKEAFAGGWFHSGDVGYFDEEGFLYVVDRIKDVINTGGVLVASREVEEALFTHPAVLEVAVIGVDDPKWIEAITAVVVLKEGVEVSEAELIEHSKKHLAPFKVPKKIVFTQELPKSTAGKILKRNLRKEI